MPKNRIFYSRFGRKPAQLSAVFPGLGQLYNKQYLKAGVVVSIFTFACGLTLLLASRATVEAWLMVLLIATVPPIWGFSIYDAYQVGVEQRRLASRRFNAEICTVIRGCDADNNNFEEVTMTKNVSRTGACLILTRTMNSGSQVSLEFEGHHRVPGRVVWDNQTRNGEHLVGMDLLTPTQFD
jgi:PilZ domain-containing protein/uncharacterized protein DUF5683